MLYILKPEEIEAIRINILDEGTIIPESKSDIALFDSFMEKNIVKTETGYAFRHYEDDMIQFTVEDGNYLVQYSDGHRGVLTHHMLTSKYSKKYEYNGVFNGYHLAYKIVNDRCYAVVKTDELGLSYGRYKYLKQNLKFEIDPKFYEICGCPSSVQISFLFNHWCETKDQAFEHLAYLARKFVTSIDEVLQEVNHF